VCFAVEAVAGAGGGRLVGVDVGAVLDDRIMIVT
jgi:hypothetical protein